MNRFQANVARWMRETFGEQISQDREERGRRLVEEALELGQSVGVTQEQAAQLVAYVFGRPVGEPSQEVGGVMVTLAALCNVVDINIEDAGTIEIERCWANIEKIRAKQVSKSLHGIGMELPAPPSAQPDPKETAS